MDTYIKTLSKFKPWYKLTTFTDKTKYFVIDLRTKVSPNGDKKEYKFPDFAFDIKNGKVSVARQTDQFATLVANVLTKKINDKLK